MDIKDVSSVDLYRAFLDQIKSNATRASLRNGEIAEITLIHISLLISSWY